MPRFDVKLSTAIYVTVTVDAPTEKDARNQWFFYDYALQEAKMAVAEEAKYLEDFEFDVKEVTRLEEDDEDATPPQTS